MLEAPDGLKPTSIYLYEASVTGTETALLAAAAAPGRIRDPPRRLRAARRRAVRVSRASWASASRRGHADDSHRRRRAGCAAPSIGCGATTSRPAAGRSSRRSPAARLRSRGARAEDMEVVAAVLKRLNVALHDRTTSVFRVERVARRRRPAASRPGLWPGFPSDLVSLVTVLATQAEGRTLVHDWMYELRLFALEQLSGMSADLFLCDPHRIIVTGPRRLRGRPLDSRDLRSGMALIAAALAADGQSRLSPLETVERGYGAARRAAAGAGREGREASLTLEPSRCTGVRKRSSLSEDVANRPTLASQAGAGCDGCRRLAAGSAGGRRLGFGGSRRPAAARPAAGSSVSGRDRVAADAERRRSASVRSSTRMMCGVSVRMMSV